MQYFYKQIVPGQRNDGRGSHLLRALCQFSLRNETLLIGGLLVLIVAVTSIAAAMQGRYYMDGHHPGNMMAGALNVLHGQPLLSQVQSIYGVFLPHLNALQLYMFGETYLSLWVLPIVAFAGGLVIYHKLFRTFLGPLESFIAVVIMLALNGTVLMPWSNYLVFGVNALILLMYCRVLNQSDRRLLVLAAIGVLIFCATLIRPQDILLFAGLLLVLAICSSKDRISQAAALGLGLLVPLVTFVAWLAYNGTLVDYYLQTIAVQDRLYFADKGPLFGVSQIFEVFATGYAAGKTHFDVGFAPFGNLFGVLWLLVFLPSAFVVIRVGFSALTDLLGRNRIHQEVPPGVLLVAMLTAIGPLFALHNVWDNFRYALHMAQGVGVIFYCVNQMAREDVARAISVTITFFFFTPIFAEVDAVKTSIAYLDARRTQQASAPEVKYFENIEMPPVMRERLALDEKFFRSYGEKYPDSCLYTSMWAITDGIYAVGKIPICHKTLTNDHFAPTFYIYYPEYPAMFDQAARSRKLIFITVDGSYTGLVPYDYVKFREVNGLSIFIARERAESFEMP